MSKKKDRAWFVCRQWTDLVARHHASDTEVNRALKPIRKSWGGGSGTRVAKSTLLRCYDVMPAGTISAQQLPTWSLIRDYPDGPVSRSMLVGQSTDFMKS